MNTAGTPFQYIFTQKITNSRIDVYTDQNINIPEI